MKNLKIKFKLLIIFGTIVVLFAAVSFWGNKVHNRINDGNFNVISEHKAVNNLLSKLNIHLLDFNNSFLMFRQTGKNEDIEKAQASLKTVRDLIEKSSFNDDVLVIGFRDYAEQTAGLYRDITIDLNKLKKENNEAQLLALTGQVASNIATFYAASNDFFKSNTLRLNELEQQNLAYANAQKNKLLYFQLGLIVLILLLITIPYRVVSKSTNDILKIIQKIENGDLTNDFKSDTHDEFGLIINGLAELQSKLKSMLGSLKSTTQNIFNASSEFSTGAQTISSGANTQAASSEEISAAMEQIAEVFKSSSDNAAETNRIAEKAFKGIQTGASHVESALSVIEDIAEKNSIISEISYQTKILSINASVEAARAAEFGKSFAVVAEEVKKLAENTQESALEISSVSKEGVELTRQSASDLHNLVSEFQKTSELIDQIAQASQEHILTIEQINNSIQEFNNVTQQNASSAEELAASSDDLLQFVESLQSLMSVFRIEDADTITESEKTEETDFPEDFSTTDFQQEEQSYDFPEPDETQPEEEQYIDGNSPIVEDYSENESEPDVRHEDVSKVLEPVEEMEIGEPEKTFDDTKMPDSESVETGGKAAEPLANGDEEDEKTDWNISHKKGIRINLADNDDYDDEFKEMK
ncbi:MAG: methyl-accepting chemotaxis protein [Prolixibacteraceae bacterium]|nr:methyl-accepting chemotaxis protein [Prolixibacteraceae bacterium]